jgi:intraflagellar transport protein 88
VKDKTVAMYLIERGFVTDSNYVDPIGPQAERPRTAARRRDQQPVADEFVNDDIADDLLPD